ncbi:MAG TPA: RDD family protein [Candidatus Kapabacteria bacterium]|nr:RDD family protein [Candidatus Kapabacteria bacterium]
MNPISEIPNMETTVILYAGFWRRIFAVWLDELVFGTAVAILIVILAIISGSFPAPRPGNQNVFRVGLIVIYVIAFVGSWLYSALMESSKLQATVGKLAVGLRVTDREGRRISFTRASARYFSGLVSLAVPLFYTIIAFNSKKRALHDFIAGTLVLSKQSTVPSQVAENAFATL